MTIELRHLRYFMAVAEELHFGRAAERLHMAQPPLSQQIRQLEEEIGFQLFYRTKRSVALTEAGTVFLQECQRLFRQLDQAIQAGRQVSRGEMGQLVIGFVSSAAYNVLPKILRAFRAMFPKVSLELHELTTDQQIAWLQEGRIDVGLVRPPVIEKDFKLTPIFEEPLVLALPESHPMALLPAVSLAKLSQEGFILFPRPLAPGLYDQIIGLFQEVGYSPTIVQEAIQMQTIISLVAAEIGVAVVPVSLKNLQRPGVIYKPLEEPTPKAAIALLHRYPNPSPTVAQFLTVVQMTLPPVPSE